MSTKSEIKMAVFIFLQGDDPPYLAVGTEVSAKYKGAFCEAKVRKVIRSVKCKVRTSSLQVVTILTVINNLQIEPELSCWFVTFS
jgi:hypothetical protein